MKIKSKKTKVLIGVIIVILLLGTGVAIIISGLIVPKAINCEIEPTNYLCVCAEGKEKLQQGFPYGDIKFVCKDIPTLPVLTFPIETWGGIRAYAVQQGLDACPGDAFLPDVPLNKEVGSGNYNIECRRQLTSDSGQIVWTTTFSTVDGTVLQRDCNPSIMGECPESIEIGNLEDPPELQIEGYVCNTPEMDDYIKSLDGLAQSVILDKLKTSCENPTGTPIAHHPPFKIPTETKYSASIHKKICYTESGGSYVCGGEDYRTVVCSIALEGASLGMWGARVYVDGTLETSGVKCADTSVCDPNDPRYTTFKMVEVGVCFAISPEKSVTIYRMENNACSELTILDTNKLSSDYDSLSECEADIVPTRVWLSYGDNLLETAYNRYDWVDRKCAGGIQGYSFGYCGSSISHEGGCSSWVGLDLDTASCNSLSNALFCGKITPQQFKDTVISRNLLCYPNTNP